MRKIFTLILSSFLSFSAVSQTSSISGAVADADQKKPIVNAVVAILRPGDSMLVKFTRTDNSGQYLLKDIKQADYILLVTHPYYADLLDNINNKSDLVVPDLALRSKAKL